MWAQYKLLSYSFLFSITSSFINLENTRPPRENQKHHSPSSQRPNNTRNTSTQWSFSTAMQLLYSFKMMELWLVFSMNLPLFAYTFKSSSDTRSKAHPPELKKKKKMYGQEVITEIKRWYTYSRNTVGMCYLCDSCWYEFVKMVSWGKRTILE